MEYILQGTYWMYGNATATTEKKTFTCPKLALKERDRLQTIANDEAKNVNEGLTYTVEVEWV